MPRNTPHPPMRVVGMPFPADGFPWSSFQDQIPDCVAGKEAVSVLAKWVGSSLSSDLSSSISIICVTLGK
jgi:hypothetical protein